MACHARSELALLGLADVGGRLPFEEPGVAPNYAPSWTFRIEHADVSLVVHPSERRWEGRIALSITPLATWSGVARLDAEDLTLDAVEDGEGHPLAWRQGSDHLEIEAGDARTLVIRFRGKDPRAGLYFVGPDEAHPDRSLQAWTQLQDEDAHFVFPCLDHPRVRHPWTLTLDAPEGMTLLSNGVRLREETIGGRTVAVWRQDRPAPAYLISFVAAPLDVHEGGEAAVPVRYLVPPGTPVDRVTRSMQRTPEMIACYADWTGVPYPWPRYDQVVVHDFVFGGMENTGCTTMTELLLVDERVGPHWDAEGLVCHELAHQWFGDLVTCQDWSQAWLNESFATFLETVWEEHAHGPDRAAWLAYEQFRAYLSEDGERYRRAIESYGFVEPIDVFDRHLYEKGSVVLRCLRAELGSDAFRAGVRLYLERHADEAVHARHLQRALEDATGTNLDGFFTRWIRTPGHPVYTVSVVIEASAVRITFTLADGAAEPPPGGWQVHLPVEIVGEDGARTVLTAAVARPEVVLQLPTQGRAAMVAIDPDFAAPAVLRMEADVPVLRAMASDPRPVLAARAVAALADKGGRAAQDVLAEVARTHPVPGVRADAIAAWGAKGVDDEGLDLLIGALEGDEDPRVTVAAAKAIGARRTPAAFDALVASLEAGPTTWHSVAAHLEAIGATRDPRAIDRLTPWTERPSWGDTVARGALSGLAATRSDAAVAPLIAWTRAVRDDRAMAGAASALGALAAAVPSARAACRERLEDLALGGGFRTRVAAVDALGRAEDGRALPVLRRIRSTVADGRVRRGAFEAIARLERAGDTPTALSRALSRLDALDAETRRLRTRLDRHDPA